MGPQQGLVGEQGRGRELAGGAEVEGLEAVIVDRYDTFSGPELRDDLGEVAWQRALPAEGVDVAGEGRCAELRETPQRADALRGFGHPAQRKSCWLNQ